MKYFLLHKPRGCITSTVDDAGRGRPTVYDVARAAGVPDFGPVGRLDFDTSGVLLFTDDFKLKKAISSPYYKGRAEVGTVPSMEKVYHALIAGTVKPDEKGVHQLREPMHFNRKRDGKGGSWTKPAEVRVLLTKTFQKGQPVPWRFKPGTTSTITWIEVVLREGKNRQIRRLCHRSEFELTRLHRVSVGPIILGDLPEGHSRELKRGEIKALYRRCLPEDPLCPTVEEVSNTLRRRLERTAQRRTPPQLPAICARRPAARPRPSADSDSRLKAQPSDGPDSADFVRGSDGNGRGEADSDEDLSGVLALLIAFAKRDLHEISEGYENDASGSEACLSEEDSLAQARAVPPNESHMVCGYRSSQIERLGLEYAET